MRNMSPENWLYYQTMLNDLTWIFVGSIFLLSVIWIVREILYEPPEENSSNQELTIEQKINIWQKSSKKDLEKAYELAMLNNNEEEMDKIKYFLEKKKNHEWVWFAIIVLFSIKGIIL